MSPAEEETIKALQDISAEVRKITERPPSLRDWLAATIDIPLALACQVAESDHKARGAAAPTPADILVCRAQLRYAEADAMLEARERPKAAP